MIRWYSYLATRCAWYRLFATCDATPEASAVLPHRTVSTLQHIATHCNPTGPWVHLPTSLLAPFLTREIQQKPTANVNHILINMVHMSYWRVCVHVFECVCVCV